MLVRGLPPCFGITLPSMIIGIVTTMVSTLVIFIARPFIQRLIEPASVTARRTMR